MVWTDPVVALVMVMRVDHDPGATCRHPPPPAL
jgi:hypothetical protein